MSLESDIHDWFEKNQWKWKLKDGRRITPTDEEIEAAFDEAARILQDEPVGTRLEVGRLIIEKRPVAYDVYVYAGQFY